MAIIRETALTMGSGGLLTHRCQCTECRTTWYEASNTVGQYVLTCPHCPVPSVELALEAWARCW